MLIARKCFHICCSSESWIHLSRSRTTAAANCSRRKSWWKEIASRYVQKLFHFSKLFIGICKLNAKSRTRWINKEDFLQIKFSQTNKLQASEENCEKWLFSFLMFRELREWFIDASLHARRAFHCLLPCLEICERKKLIKSNSNPLKQLFLLTLPCSRLFYTSFCATFSLKPNANRRQSKIY